MLSAIALRDQLRRCFRRVAGLSVAQDERSRLLALARYADTISTLPGFAVKVPDAASFLASWNEIFVENIYEFRTASRSPRILDCGANVGISCIYFKRLFPTSRITAFEGDPKIVRYLEHNLQQAGITDIEVVAKALWSEETTLLFRSEGSDAGRIATSDEVESVVVPTVRLSTYLQEPVDMVKLDIEGAEFKVLEEAAAALVNVGTLFVEYHSFAGERQTLSEILAILRGAGFRVHIHPVRIADKPFVEVPEVLGMDMQVNIFAFRSCA